MYRAFIAQSTPNPLAKYAALLTEGEASSAGLSKSVEDPGGISVAGGGSWKAWTPADAPMTRPDGSNHSCEWERNVRMGSGTKTEIRADLCLRNERNELSDFIRETGKNWKDCAQLVWLYRSSAAREELAAGQHDRSDSSDSSDSGVGAGTDDSSDSASSSMASSSVSNLVVEVGAGVGACSLELLLRTDATLAVFEPNPVNLFYLTQTLHSAARTRPKAKIERRCVVFPLALGRGSSASSLVEAQYGTLAGVAVGSMAPHAGPWTRAPLRLPTRRA